MIPPKIESQQELPHEKPIVAAFDFDGTISSRDCLLPFILFSCGIWITLFGLFRLIPTFIGFSLGLISRQKTKEAILSRFFAGNSLEIMNQQGERFASSDRFKRHILPSALARIDWHIQRGHKCILISAAIDTYLKPWAKQVGFDETITSLLETNEKGICTGRLKGVNCWGQEKLERLSKVLGPRENYSLYAYGDSRGDEELLQTADFPFYKEMPKSEETAVGPAKQESASFHDRFLTGWRFNAMIATIIFSVIGYFAFTLWGGWKNVVLAVADIGVFGISAALALSLLSFWLRFLRWQLYLQVLGHPIPWKPSLRIYMAGFSLTITPGKSGEALRSLFLKNHEVPFRKSFGAFFSERLSDLIAVVILASSGLWIYPEGRPVLFVVLFAVIFLLYAIQRESWLQAVERKAKKILPVRFYETIEFLLETILAFKSCFTPPILISGMILGTLSWAVQGFALYYILNLIGYDINLMTSLFIYGFSLLVGAITLLPGGLGGTEVTMVQLLIVNHLPPSIAVAVTLIIRLATLWFSVLIGILALPKSQKSGP